MNQLKNLIESIITRVNVNLHEFADVGPHIHNLINYDNFSAFYAFYALTDTHPLHFKFSESCISGTYFLGKCHVDRSVIYKSDIRGDELKRKGDIVEFEGMKLKLYNDEFISIRDSFLVKTLVHNKSHDPENLEKFAIRNTVALHWSNIHSSSPSPPWTSPARTTASSAPTAMCRPARYPTPTWSRGASGSAPKGPSTSTTNSRAKCSTAM